MNSQVNLLIVGGCFPIQDNIAQKDLYHQILKTKIEKEYSKNVIINILHYEKLYPTYDKIRSTIEKQTPDLIIFHIRTEQILRMIKFYFKYHDKNMNFHKSFNFALLGIINPEKESFNLYRRPSTIKNTVRKSNYFLVELNYLLGYLFLNQFFAFQDYKKLITKIVNLTKEKSLKIIFTGPVSRPKTFFENLTSTILSSYMKKNIQNKLRVTYLDFLGSYEKNQFLFCEDHIRVNGLGHKRIAMILFESIKNILFSHP